MDYYQKCAISLTLAGACLLSGCAPIVVAGGATAIGSSAMEERGIKGVLSDNSIRAQVNTKWFDHDPTLNESVELSVREGRILLTGTLDTTQQQIDAVRLAWQVEGVREVIDETKVGKGSGVKGYASDTWVTTKLKASLLFEEDIYSNNYSLKTVEGTVYLIGIAQDQEELDRVIDIVRNSKGVKEVVNYVRLKSEPHPAQASATG